MNKTDDDHPRHKTSRETLIDLYYDSIPLISINIIWFLLTLPIITALPAAAGLYYCTKELAYQNQAGWGTFFEGFRKYFWLSWKWGLTVYGGFIILVFNLYFYGGFNTTWAFIVQIIFIWLIVLWALVNLYTFPMLFEQERKSMRLALRNSLVILGTRMWKSLGLVILDVLIIVVSVLFPLLLVIITGSLIAYMASKTTATAVAQLKKNSSVTTNKEDTKK